MAKEKEKDGKADPKGFKGGLKRLRHRRPGFHVTLVPVGMLTAVPQIQYNLFIMKVIMVLNQFYMGIPFELIENLGHSNLISFNGKKSLSSL